MGHSPDSGGSTSDKRTKRFFYAGCQAKRMNFSFGSFAENEKK